MMHKIAAVLLFFFMAPLYSVTMAPPSVEVDPVIAAEVEDYLNLTPPSPLTDIYAITSVTDGTEGVFVSLVGLDADTPAPYDWSFENDEQIVWIGSLLKVEGDYSVYDPDPLTTQATGGGADVSFPWAIGSKMLFGPLGIHGAQENAVDWVSGDDMGAGAAGPEVYASSSGTVISVCEDGTQKGYVIDGEYRFGYLHLQSNSSLTQGQTVTRGQYLGRLKYGSFDDTCGGASQEANHYHLHWTFQPADGHFQAESWILNYSTSEWVRGNQKVKINQWMTGGGGTQPEDPEDPEDPGGETPVATPRFFTYLLTGVRSVWGWFLGYFPDSYPDSQYRLSLGMARSALMDVISMANILLAGGIFDFMPIIYAYLAILGIKLLLFLVGVVILILGWIKMLPAL